MGCKPFNIETYNAVEKKNITTYYVGNPSPGLGQAHICGGVKPVIGSQPSSLDTGISNSNTYIVSFEFQPLLRNDMYVNLQKTI